MMHNLFCNNCHSHCATILEMFEYLGARSFTMITVWWMCIVEAKYVSYGHIVKIYIGFIFLCLFVFSMIFLMK